MGSTQMLPCVVDTFDSLRGNWKSLWDHMEEENNGHTQDIPVMIKIKISWLDLVSVPLLYKKDSNIIIDGLK